MFCFSNTWPSLAISLYGLCKKPPSSRCCASAMKRQGAKLQTATSSGDVYSMISLQRLEQWMVPKFC